MAALAGMLDTLDRRGQALDRLTDEQAREQIAQMMTQARAAAASAKTAESERLAAIRILGREASQRQADLDLLGKLLTPQNPPALQTAALATLGRIADDRVVAILAAGWNSHSPAVRLQVLDLCLSRDAWQRQLLSVIEKNEVPAAALDTARRQRLLAHKDAQVRARAAKLFGGATSPDRQKVLDAYQDVASMTGDTARGKAVFAKSCAACHRLEDAGYHVGPNLAALTNRSPAYLLMEILDPSKNMDSRYVEYLAVTRSGRTFTGILSSESATGIALRGPESKEQVLLRSELEELQSNGKSLMPEGLEKDLSRQDLADVIAYLAAGPPPAEDAAALARQLLDDKLPRDQRQAIIDAHPDQAVELLQALLADLRPGTPEEYRRIPWIWRVTVAAGKRNQADTIRRVLEVALPKAGEPLHDWQAVVIGGGVINGISLQGVWPLVRLNEVLKGNADLTERWQKALPQAAEMADNEKVPTGTRYDALRMLALDAWERRGGQLARYMAKGIHNELQMGAISGLSDMDVPQAAPLLIAGLDHYSPANRKLALDALLRTEARTAALLAALEHGKVRRAQLGETHVEALRTHPNESLRARARKLLAP
jgi:putative heme-binding domain-containing protein